jgi:hypothetical protein
MGSRDPAGAAVVVSERSIFVSSWASLPQLEVFLSQSG